MEYRNILLFGLSSLVPGVVRDVLVVHVDLLEFVQLGHAALHFSLHHLQKVEILSDGNVSTFVTKIDGKTQQREM